MIVAPLSSSVFHNVNIQFGWCKLTQYNFVNFLVAITSLAVVIISYFKLRNLTTESAYHQVKHKFIEECKNDCLKIVVSDENKINLQDVNKEYKSFKVDKKDKRHKTSVFTNENARKDIKDNQVGTTKNTKLWTFKDITNQPEVMVILAVDSFLSFQCQIEILVDMFAVLVFRWSMLQLSICISVSIFFVTILLLVVEKIVVGDIRSIYFLYVLAFLSNMMANSLLGIVSTIILGQEFWQFFTISLLLVLGYLPYFASYVYCRSILFYITPEHSASIVDSYRQVIHQSSMALGFFMTNSVYNVLRIMMLPYSVIAFCIVILLLCWFKTRYFVRSAKGRGGATQS